MIRNDAPRHLAQAYERYQPLLLSAVKAMRRKGVHISPASALDLVHDFYLDKLDDVLGTYKPSRGKFAPYLYGAFVRFAYKRIADDERWKRILAPLDEVLKEPAVDPVEGEDDGGDERPDEPDTSPSEQARLAGALERLPPAFRKILEARLAGCASERELARRLRLSRHAVRRRLGEAIGRAAVAVGHDKAISGDLRSFASRLWRDEIPLMQVAKEFKLSRHQAWQRYRELVRSLAAAAAATLEDVPALRKVMHHG